MKIYLKYFLNINIQQDTEARANPSLFWIMDLGILVSHEVLELI
jgi:hypothetical protein